MKDFNFDEIDFNRYEWDEKPQMKPQIKCDNPDIYKMDIKQMNQYISNQLNIIISMLTIALEK